MTGEQRVCGAAQVGLVALCARHSLCTQGKLTHDLRRNLIYEHGVFVKIERDTVIFSY